MIQEKYFIYRGEVWFMSFSYCGINTGLGPTKTITIILKALSLCLLLVANLLVLRNGKFNYEEIKNDDAQARHHNNVC